MESSPEEIAEQGRHRRWRQPFVLGVSFETSTLSGLVLGEVDLAERLPARGGITRRGLDFESDRPVLELKRQRSAAGAQTDTNASPENPGSTPVGESFEIAGGVDGASGVARLPLSSAATVASTIRHADGGRRQRPSMVIRERCRDFTV